MTVRPASLSPYGHPRAAVPQYGRRYHREGTIMKKLSMIGIVGGAALLAAVPLSLQWSQVGPAVPLLTVSHANAQYYGPTEDQFFTEEQFEVYRALGFHMVCGFFDRSDKFAFL